MTDRTRWFKTFFSGMAVDLWREAMSEEQTASEVEFIKRVLHLPSSSKLLDVPCGNGRHSLKLAASGCRMTGVDISSEFLDEAREQSARMKLNIVFDQREMHTLPWHEEFDGAFCFGNSFGYLGDDGNIRFLNAIVQALKHGGRFLLDANSCAEIILPNFQERSQMQIGDILFTEVNRYDHEKGRYDTQYTFERNGNIERKFGSHRIYTYREISEMLKEAGFTACKAYGSLQLEPFTLGSKYLFFVGEKDAR